MYSCRLTKLLLLPSLSSGVLVVGIAAGVLGYNTWMYITKNQLFYDNLFGAYGLKTYVWEHSLGATTWKNSFLASPLAYYVFVIVAALAAGLAVYTVVEIFGLLVRGGRLALRGLVTLLTVHHRVRLARLGLRILALVGWALYTAFFLSTLLPFVTILSQTGVDRVHGGVIAGWWACTGAFAILVAALHLQVVFVRLVLLRARLLLGDRAIEEAES